MDDALSTLWGHGVEEVIAGKVKDREEYMTKLRKLFEVYARKKTDSEFQVEKGASVEDEAAAQVISETKNVMQGDAEEEIPEEENGNEANKPYTVTEQEGFQDTDTKHGE